MKKKAILGSKSEAPIFNLHAFGKKPSWTDFYIQNISDHIKEHEFIGKPHKHDFYLIMFVSHGKGAHVIDFIEYQVQPNSIFLMTPGQVHTWTLSDDIDGFIIFFTREFYQIRLSDNDLLEFPFFHSLVASPLIRPAKDEVVNFTLQQMNLEYRGSNEPNLRLIRAYLDVLLLEVAKYYNVSHTAKTRGSIHKLRKLEQLINENFRTLKQPGDYGDLMNLAPSYLNSICKETVGKTLTDLIQQRILLEAKRMFAYSDLNVNEVAAKLNFSDPSYFIRWFRKQTQQPPDEFRKHLMMHGS
jgi:AraC-like DNA-binding protein